MNEIEFQLRGEYIELDKLLKATGVADSGGQARMMITQGLVTVDGQPESRKTAKMRAGQRIGVQGQQIRILG